jgi:hypothetical protein
MRKHDIGWDVKALTEWIELPLLWSEQEHAVGTD